MCDNDGVMKMEMNILTHPTRLSKSRIVIHLTALGDPLSKQRPRLSLNKGGTVYTPKKTKEAEEAIAWQVKASSPALFCDSETLFGIRLIFCQATYQRRDIDNMVKLVLDSCDNVVWKDDNQVVEINAYKIPNVGEQFARTEICIYRVGSLENEFSTCPTCGKRFRTHPSWKKANRQYCSRSCSGYAQRKRAKRICLTCKKEFEYLLCYRANRQFCSQECRLKYLGDARLKCICQNCGKEFSIPPNKRFRNVVYCSETCRISFSRKHITKTPENQRGICSICGKPTSRKTYTLCLACSLAQGKFRYYGKSDKQNPRTEIEIKGEK